MSWRSPASVRAPSGVLSRSRAPTFTSSRLRWIWLGVFMCWSKIARAIGTRAGWATQVPSWPSVTSRSLSARTFASAASFASGLPLIGICAAMPPMAWTPRRWQVRMRSCTYARRKPLSIVRSARSGKTCLGSARKRLIVENW